MLLTHVVQAKFPFSAMTIKRYVFPTVSDGNGIKSTLEVEFHAQPLVVVNKLLPEGLLFVVENNFTLVMLKTEPAPSCVIGREKLSMILPLVGKDCPEAGEDPKIIGGGLNSVPPPKLETMNEAVKFVAKGFSATSVTAVVILKVYQVFAVKAL